MNKELISVVIPVYGDKKLVKLLYQALLESFAKIDVEFEIIMVNDACPYGSGEEIEKLALIDNRVKFIDLSRNFGQHYAIKAGIDHASGDWLVVMDCDLQDNPEEISNLYKKAKEGYDIVLGIRKKRKDSFLKRIISKAYRIVIHSMSELTPGYDHGNYSIISRKVIEKFKEINDYNFNYGTVIDCLGFSPAYIDINKEERVVGKSGYNILKGVVLALRSIIANSNKPLVFSAYCSFFMFLLSFAFAAKLIIDYFIYQERLIGWSSIMVSIFFIGGLIFAYLSILGLYIGGIFNEVKTRPIYLIKKTVNLKNKIK